MSDKSIAGDDRSGRAALTASTTEALLTSMVDGVVTIDEHGTIETVNPAVEKMFGYRADEMIGRNVSILMARPDREEHDAYLQRYRQTGEKQIIGIGREVTGRRKDGELFPIDLAVSEVEVEGRRIFLGTLHEISERVAAEKALRASREELRRQRDFAETLVDAAPIIVLVLDCEGRIVRLNRALVAIGERSPDEVVGRDWFDTFVPVEDRLETREQFGRSLAGASQRGVIRHLQTASGERRPIEWSDRVLRDEAGEVVGLLLVGQDVTQRLALEETARHAQKMHALGRLAGGVAHDFNTLLASILGYGDMLLAALAVDSDPYRWTRELLKAAGRGAELTRQLLTFSHHRAPVTEIVDLNEVVVDLEEMLGRLIGEDIELEVALDPSPVTVRADHGRLGQVVMNLVINASQALSRDGRIRIETRHLDRDETPSEVANGAAAPSGWVSLRVIDNGIGMDEETRRRAFEPFFTTKSARGGTGLGLAMVYGIITQAGGEVRIDSAPGQGARVDVLLPRVEGKAAQRQEPRREGLRAGDGQTILLVEDDRLFLEMLTELLDSRGYSVVAARSPEEAIERTAGDGARVDLLITDLVMPGMSIEELIGRLTDRFPDLQVLCMSGYTEESLRERGLDRLESSFLQKPFATADLLVAIQKLV